MNYFERYETGERSLYNFNGELKKLKWDGTEFNNRLLREYFGRQFNSSVLQNIMFERGVGFGNSIPTRTQSIGRIIRDEVYPLP